MANQPFSKLYFRIRKMLIIRDLIQVKIKEITFVSIYLFISKAMKKKINRKFRVPWKQGAHFLGAGAQIQDSWVFSSSA
jgi:hypothetical protein